MRVDHCGSDILMAEQLLDRADIVPVLKQVGGERMAKRVARGPFDQASPLNGLLNCLLNDRVVHMVSPLLAPMPVYPAMLLRK